MDENTITRTILDTFDHVRKVTAWGDMFFYYNPDPEKADEIYFATLKSADDDYDNASDLNRPGIFRLNISIGKETFLSLFGARPARPGPEGQFDEVYDFTALDTLMPHPVYGRQYWVCVLNPGAQTLETIWGLLAEAHALAAAKYRG